jgi:hypothetical protein
MNKLPHLLTLTKSFSKIKNIDLPICVNCVHFIKHDSLPSIEIYGKCKKFGEMNLVTGSIEYEFATVCRIYDKKCGKNGLEYKR